MDPQLLNAIQQINAQQEEVMKIKTQAKLDRKEKQDDEEYDHQLGVTGHSQIHGQYHGMTTYKDLGMQ